MDEPSWLSSASSVGIVFFLELRLSKVFTKVDSFRGTVQAEPGARYQGEPEYPALLDRSSRFPERLSHDSRNKIRHVLKCSETPPCRGTLRPAYSWIWRFAGLV